MAVTAAALTAVTAVLAPLLDESQLTNVALTYLFITLVASALWGFAVGIFAAVAGNLALNFFFVPPLHRFSVQRPENLVALLLFLAVAVVGSLMLARFREQLHRANVRDAETAILLEASREVAREANPQAAMDRLCQVIGHALGVRGCSVLSGEPLAVTGATIDSASAAAPTRDEVAVAKQALTTGELVRLRGDGRTVQATFVALTGTTKGVLRLIGPVKPPSGIDSERLLAALIDEASIALDRMALSREAARAESLARAEEFKSTLLSSVSHDLRTPLTAIRAAATSLMDESVEWTPEDRHAFLSTIESQSDQLTHSVGNLLQMTRLESGVTAQFEPVEVAPLLEEVALAAAAATKGRELRRHSPPELWVRADYALLLHALVNLVENSAKYSTAGMPIEVEASGSPGRVFIRIRDAGPGIAPADVPHVFEKFYRGTSSRGTSGSGLGLALVKAMIETCEGTVSVSSSAAGTVFEVSLPAARRPKE